MKRFTKNIILLLMLPCLFGYIMVHVFVYFYQNKLMYFPSNKTSPIEKNWVSIYGNDDGNKKIFLGYELIRKNSGGKTVVVFHGNGGGAENRIFYAKVLPDNYNIFLAEYPGYGRNFDEEISMDGILLRSRVVMNYLIFQELAKNKSYQKNITVLGESLGSGVASKMADEFQVKKLMLVIPYDSILNAAKMRYPWLWVGPILKNNFDNIAFLKNYTGSVLMAVAEKDDVLDPSLAFNLFKNLPNIQKEEIIVKNAHHLDCYSYLSSMDIKKIHAFLK